MTTHTNSARHDRSLFAAFRDAFLGFIEVMGSASHAAACAREADRLFELSDEELARRGLTRDKVVHHAFRSYLHS
jgi:hypothetical protein